MLKMFYKERGDLPHGCEAKRPPWAFCPIEVGVLPQLWGKTPLFLKKNNSTTTLIHIIILICFGHILIKGINECIKIIHWCIPIGTLIFYHNYILGGAFFPTLPYKLLYWVIDRKFVCVWIHCSITRVSACGSGGQGGY